MLRTAGHASQHTMNTLYEARNDHRICWEAWRHRNLRYVCDGKAMRERFDDVREPATSLLERIHRDVCGLIEPPDKSVVFRFFKEYEAVVTSQWQSRSQWIKAMIIFWLNNGTTTRSEAFKFSLRWRTSHSKTGLLNVSTGLWLKR